MIKPWIKRSAIALVLLAVASAVGMQYARQNPKAEEPKFRTAAVDEGAITQVVLATGTLQPVITVNVGTQVSGTVLERRADFNDHVAKGQILLRLDPANLQARLRQTRAQLAANEAALVLAQTTYARNEKLVSAGFISALTLDQGRREVDAAQANVERTRPQVETAQTDLVYSLVGFPTTPE